MVTRARLASAFLAAIGLAASTAACASIFGFEELEDRPPSSNEASTTDATTDASTDTFVPPDPRCGSLDLPEPPTSADAGEVAPIVVALRKVDFGIDTNAAAVGFNLDKACTQSVDQSTCRTNVDEQTFNRFVKDRNPQGLDNAGVELLQQIKIYGGAFSPAEVNRRLGDGEYGAVLRLSGYNGLPDDDRVVLEVFPAVGVLVPDDAGTPVKGKPAFKKTDVWQRDRRFDTGGTSAFLSTSAYVKGGVLVASFKTVTLPISVPDDKKPLDIVIQGGFVKGAIVDDGGGFRLKDAVLGGRWRTADMLSQVRTIYIADTLGVKNKYLCEPGLVPDVYKLVKTAICDARDLRAVDTEDKKDLPCNAFSTAMVVDTYPVDDEGPLTDLPPEATAARCTMPGAVPVGDDCAP